MLNINAVTIELDALAMNTPALNQGFGRTASYVLVIFLLFACREKKTPESLRPEIDTSPKAVRFKDQPPNVTSVQLTYNNGLFSVDTIAAVSGRLSPAEQVDSLDHSANARTYKFSLFKLNQLAYTTYVRVDPSMHTFQYENDRVSHEEVKTNKSFFNVNIPLDTALITRITIEEVVEVKGQFVRPDSIKGLPIQVIIIPHQIR